VVRLITTLENVRLTEGDRVVVYLGSGIQEVEILDATDQSKLRVKLDNGAEVWIGRKACMSRKPGVCITCEAI